MKNKKASKMLSVYWFAVLVIVAVGVAYMVAIFYSAPYDVREVEANLIESKLIDCLVSDNHFNSEVIVLDSNQKFFDYCEFTFNVDDYSEEDNGLQYYVDVQILDFDSSEVKKEFSGGNLNLKDYCEVSKEKERSLPFCLTDSVYSIGQAQEKYKINFVIVVNKNEKNI